MVASEKMGKRVEFGPLRLAYGSIMMKMTNNETVQEPIRVLQGGK